MVTVRNVPALILTVRMEENNVHTVLVQIILVKVVSSVHIPVSYTHLQVAAKVPDNYLGNFWRARVNSLRDPETTQGLAKPYYEAALSILCLLYTSLTRA